MAGGAGAHCNDRPRYRSLDRATHVPRRAGRGGRRSGDRRRRLLRLVVERPVGPVGGARHERSWSPLRRPDGKGPWVVVLGGGVGGMSAAHELRRARAAGHGAGEAIDPRRQGPEHAGARLAPPAIAADLPGEHGFRFFPGFYEHLPDTMKRIPLRVEPQRRVRQPRRRPGDHDGPFAGGPTSPSRSRKLDVTLGERQRGLRQRVPERVRPRRRRSRVLRRPDGACS